MDIRTVTEKLGSLPYMKEAQALYLQDLIKKSGTENILELGFYHGKSTCYFAAILEELGRGHITTIDMKSARRRQPNITELIPSLGLEHRVTPIFAPRSFTWELGKMLEEEERPQFDFIYLDGGHTWDGTGFGFFLCDMLLKPGGWILFDDMEWSPARSLKSKSTVPDIYRNFSQGELKTRSVRKVWELLVASRGYVNMHEVKQFEWGLAQKPSSVVRSRSRTRRPPTT